MSKASRIAILSTSVVAALTFSLATAAQAQTAATSCDAPGDIAFMPSPMTPQKGVPLRIVLASEKPFTGELSIVAPDGSVAARSAERHGGPPYFWYAEVATPAAGNWQVKLSRSGVSPDCATITHEVAVRETAGPKLSSAAGSVWPLRANWDRATENLYSAWIEKLFDATLDDPPSWNALHLVLRDKKRNMLFNYLGLGEDEANIVMKADCADMPYFLRAYFAFKMGLPFGYSKCSRGGGGKGPTCFGWTSILEQREKPAATSGVAAAKEDDDAPAPVAAPAAAPKRVGLVASFARYIPIVQDSVHSGSGRTLANDDNTDYYPVALTQETLRPGTVYADPFGHVLMFTKRVPQTDGNAGVFLAADAQPDGTVAIKRFWRGNFLYAVDPALGGPGFKRFRPIVREKNGGLRRLANAEIAKNADYGDFSLEPSKLSVEAFYDRMDDVMSPQPLDPVRAIKEAISSLDEQVKTRVTSIENGRKFLASGKGEAVMPDGPAIFETIGAWEDFSTPSRDLRLLIAIDVVRNFPDRVARRPERYAMPSGKSAAEVKAELQGVLTAELAARKFTYPRTDGSQWTLSLKDVLDRASLLEMAYNPNDCVELRWGAAEKSEEAATCKRRAPAAQHAKMAKYRPWFTERRRPPRV